MEKTDKYSFTSWKKPQVNNELCDYLIWQKEYCPKTKLEHFQGFVMFKKFYTLGQAKQCLRDKTIHIEKSFGSLEENKNYCMKNESYAGERFEYGLGYIDTDFPHINLEV